jgi:hypothetical protein
MTAGYRARTFVPPLVERAQSLAEALGFTLSSRPEVGRLLRTLAAMRPGGTIVLDDLTPEAAWPPEWHGQPDPTRELWLNDPRLAAVELIVDPSAGPGSAVIVTSYLGPEA